ncbi:tRNAHis guanylyltransferase [Rhizoclosmatium globosum]|uniref:tRNA(His) guanylyltransferase n=1 Tax=Rhizoclosmatium globosum TaxID=329046 RepID=A0A1Y2CKV9_9FUNG|nr:tRNAHis guanylyltransferase [Rhizoclosmatium globosum]|eukprot:ORY47669.1 tRNAHis guanylyltransferase [Rhizoclosmatium globosum]
MAKSKYEYVKHFEQHQTLLRNTYVVIRVDGHGFHRFSQEHNFEKPNDLRALHLANEAAKGVMTDIQDIVLAYGESDEYSFLLRRDSTLFKRREAKIVSTIASLFTSYYVVNWFKFMGDSTLLRYPPSFDARAVCYPTAENVRDYFSWRQADCHINNLYNTTFWALVQDPTKNPPMTTTQAQAILKDTTSASKNEILFKQFNINYNTLPEIFRKGSVLFRRKMMVPVKETEQGNVIEREKSIVHIAHVDIIADEFWLTGDGKGILE